MTGSTVVLAAALLINTLTYCSADNVYCVTPTVTSCSSCPPNSTKCTTLSEYAKKAESYFTPDTTMVFLPGDHILDRNITVVNVARLTMHGGSSSGNIVTIVCNGSVGLSFTLMVDFKIDSLAFSSCSRNEVSPLAGTFALHLDLTEYTTLVNCSFHENIGTALAVNNANVTLAGNTDFTHNHGTKLNSFLGGSIAALSSNLTFTGNTTFLGNSATTGAAGIYMINSSVSHSGNIHFINNSNTGHVVRNIYPAGAIWASASLLHFTGSNQFIGNSADNGGCGAICAVNNTSLSFTGTSNFSHNSARGIAGAIYTSGNTVLTFNGTSNFIGNPAVDPHGSRSAIYTSDETVLTFNGISNFIGNGAYFGGAIQMSDHTVLKFTGTSNFINNSASSGGAICIFDNAVLSFNGTSNFIGNFAEHIGGAIYTVTKMPVNFTGISNFRDNLAYGGGAIWSTTALSFNGTSNFTSNRAMGEGGGAIMASNHLSFSGTSNFISNSGGFGGGAIFTSYKITVLSGISNFVSNSVGNAGGAIYILGNAVCSLIGAIDFVNNSASHAGGGIYVSENAVLSLDGTKNFINNSASYGGGAIYADFNSGIAFNGTIYFTNNGHYGGTQNGGTYGGGVYMGINSIFSILPNKTVYWENNHATFGGAIYVVDANPLSYCTAFAAYIPKEKCFFQLPGQNPLDGISVQLVFKNNSADAAGSVLYGGVIDNCTLTDQHLHSSGKVFDKLVRIEDDNTNSKISSIPFRICHCKTTHPDCRESQIDRHVYPGETFYVSVSASGQRKETVPSPVRSYISTGKLLASQYLQEANRSCTTFNYTVFSLPVSSSSSSSKDTPKIVLYADGPCSTFSDKLFLSLTIHQKCPPGFNLSESARSCVCEPRLERYTNNCNITNGVGQITRTSGQQFWVGYDNQSDGLILNPHCPFDYCVSHTVVFPLNDTDVQCACDRSGLLCGACKEGYSLVLGTSQCRKCTNSHLALLIPFAVMGVALVFLLFVCKLTVATGTLSGLVFYANIVGVNRTIFLPVESTNAFSIFIAWLNLDFGIETCFYKGLDAYSKTWLQFVFPVYIWVLVGLMVLVSNYSRKFASLLGNNPVPVLATLILLSYTKILYTLIAVIYVTYLEYPTSNRRVWLYDANIDYVSGKHIPLFLVAVLVFLFLFLPYTLLLLFGQWLQAISHLRLFSWVNSARLKPFMDSYHAPYKAKHRYWPGLLLVLRFVLLLVFAFQFNPQQHISINLLTILVGTGVLHFWVWVSGGVYRNWCLDALEGSFALNLSILSAATYHVNLSGGNQLAVGYTSVSIALVTFIGILAYHIFQQLKKIKLCNLNLEFDRPNIMQAMDEPVDNPVDFNQFREPLLEDQPQPNYKAI